MPGKIAKFRALLNLGWPNLVRVGWYQVRLRLGIHPVQSIAGLPLHEGPFFRTTAQPVTCHPSPVWRDGPWAFGRDLGRKSIMPPDWHANILSGAKMPEWDQRWDRLPQFTESIGEIKTIWEASRFDWVLAFAQLGAVGDESRLNQLNMWLSDWTSQNPPYHGPNWMCAQEASIRVIKLAVAARILDDQMPLTSPLAALLTTHLRRIAPTTSYAIGQDNNHATSEAAALFIGGLWLADRAEDPELLREGRRYAQSGRTLLERSVFRLIMPDGGFAQYSAVYHRLMLDCMSLCELFRIGFGQPAFQSDFMERVAVATEWLDSQVLGADGDVPNIGSNDGAWLLPVGRGTYRDFRPSVSLASALFTNTSRYWEIPAANDLCEWLRISTSALAKKTRPGRNAFPESGLFHCSAGSTQAVLVVPRPYFRPHQCDPLHVDIWHRGQPIFCDSGTYSYAFDNPPGDPWLGSIAAHNCLAIGDGEPMPRLGRFLLGSWIRASLDGRDPHHVSASCKWAGAKHERRVTIKPGNVQILDCLQGTTETAILRWKTPDRELAVNGTIVEGQRFRLSITANVDFEITIRPSWVSPTYLDLQPVQQIEIRFRSNGRTEICTEIDIQP